MFRDVFVKMILLKNGMNLKENAIYIKILIFNGYN